MRGRVDGRFFDGNPLMAEPRLKPTTGKLSLVRQKYAFASAKFVEIPPSGTRLERYPDGNVDCPRTQNNFPVGSSCRLSHDCYAIGANAGPRRLRCRYKGAKKLHSLESAPQRLIEIPSIKTISQIDRRETGRLTKLECLHKSVLCLKYSLNNARGRKRRPNRSSIRTI